MHNCKYACWHMCSFIYTQRDPCYISCDAAKTRTGYRWKPHSVMLLVPCASGHQARACPCKCPDIGLHIKVRTSEPFDVLYPPSLYICPHWITYQKELARAIQASPRIAEHTGACTCHNINPMEYALWKLIKKRSFRFRVWISWPASKKLRFLNPMFLINFQGWQSKHSAQ